jgi:hypothetical protein
MRKNTLFGAVALGIAGLFVAGPIANAAQPGPGNDGRIAVDKGSYVAGETVKLSGVCRMEGVGKWKVESAAFESATEVKVVNSDSFAGSGKISKNAKPGAYTVSFHCVDQSFSAKLTVAAAKKPAAPQAENDGQVAQKPKGAADTGGEGDVATAGDTVNTAAPAQESGSNAGLFALGGAGLLAAGGAGAFALRRRARNQS